MKVLSWIVKFVVAVVFAALFAMVLSPGFAAFVGDDASVATGALFVVFAIAGALILFAPTVRRAFGRGFLLCGLAFLFLPLASMMLGGAVSIDILDEGVAAGASDAEQAGAAVGAGLAAGAMTIFAGVVGFVMGAIFLIIGLVLALGGRREVVVVDRP